jgi:hypothetical protein
VLERRAGGRQVPKEDAAGDRERDLSRQMQVMQQTFSEKIAEEKKKFAQERLLLKQQREMEEMKEISRLTHKTKQVEATPMGAQAPNLPFPRARMALLTRLQPQMLLQQWAAEQG